MSNALKITMAMMSLYKDDLQHQDSFKKVLSFVRSITDGNMST